LLDCCLRLEKSYIISKIKDRFVKDWDDLTKKYFSKNIVSTEKQFIKDYLLDYIETNQNRFFELVGDKKLYLPIGRFPFTWNELTLAEEMPELLYCFENTSERINYSLAISCENKALSLLKALLITRKTARVLIKNKIYEFDADVDGAKLMPFLDKQNVSVSQANADEYIHKVIVPLVNTNKVLASGFEIESVNVLSNAILKVREIAPIHQFSLFDDGGENSTEKSLVIGGSRWQNYPG
jgi:hypothetical protein